MDVLSQLLAIVAIVIASKPDGAITQRQNSEASAELSFMFITSKNGLFNSSGSRAAVDMALERINRDPTIVSSYHLRRTQDLDSNCNGITALRQFFSRLHDTQTRYVAVVGAGCSPATQPIAEIINYYNIPMISYASSAEVLSNRNYYPSYFRTAPSEIVLTPGLANLVWHFGWRQVVFITEEQRLFQDTQAEVRMLLSSRGIRVETREFESSRGPGAVEDIFVKERDIRVFILNMYSLFASQVLCQAYRESMFYPNYIWITYGWYNSDWWRRSKGTAHNCTDEEMLRILQQSLSIIQYPVTNTSEETNSGLTGDEFLREYESRVLEEGLEYTVTAPLAYDATWALALALNSSIQAVNNMDSIPFACTNMSDTYSKLVPYDNFTYSNDLLGCIMIENLKKTSFIGVSGRVYFDADGTRQDDSVRIEQYRTNGTAVAGVQRVVVAYLVDNISQFSYTEGESNSTLWPDGVPPDGIPLNVTTIVALPLTVITQIFAYVGIGFAIFCLAFNIIFRNRKVVRLTSPNLNYLIVVGAILIYLSLVFLSMPFLGQQISTVYCNLQQWLFLCGNTFCFAVVLTKMWRVYYIFNDPTPNRKSPKDWQLLIAIVLLVGVDVIILLIPTALPSSRLMATLTENKEQSPSLNEDGVLEIYYFYHCNNSPHLVWLGVAYAYKLLLQFVAVYFAFQTRKVKVRALNDSKEIAVIIYVTSLILIGLIGVGFAVGGTHPNVNVALSAVGRIAYPTVILVFIFVPKMVYLYQDPAGEKIFSHNTTAGSCSGPRGGNPFSEGSNRDGKAKEKVANLEKRVQELELVLKEYQQKDNVDEVSTPPDESQTEQTASSDRDNDLASPSETVLDSSHTSINTHKTLVNGTE